MSLLRNDGYPCSEETAITVPEHVLRAALRAFDSRDPAAAVAQLVDEACDEPGDPVTTRHLRFAGPGIDIDLDVVRDGDLLGVSVDVRPPFDCTLELDHRGGAVRSRTTAGHCEVARIDRGPVRVTVEGPDGRNPRRTQTTWVSL